MKRMPLVIFALCTAALVCTLCACSGSSTKTNSSSSKSGSASYLTEASGPYASGQHVVTVSVDGYEPFSIQLDADAAPVTVSHFCDEIQKGTYNGNSFHRIVQDFCLQGGDPTGTGSGSGDVAIVGEFSGNGIENALADDYRRGTVAMARTNNPNSASLQWFVTLSDGAASSLNGLYAAFGTIDNAGMDVVDRIVADYLDAAKGQSGTIPNKADQPVIESITIVS